MQNNIAAINNLRYTLAALAVLFFAGCEKDNPSVFEPEVSTAVYSASIDVEMMHHLLLYSNALCTEYNTASLFCWGAVNDSVNGNAVMLDYDFANYQIYGCGFYDTAHTSGKLTIHYTAPYQSTDTLRLQLNQFSTMGNTYNGNLLIDRSVATQHRVVIQSLTVTRNGFTYTLSGTIVADIFQTRHEVSGTLAATGGQTYTLQIASPLKVTVPISQSTHINTGKATFTNPLESGSINYGNGSEDKLATFATPDGLRYVLTLQDF